MDHSLFIRILTDTIRRAVDARNAVVDEFDGPTEVVQSKDGEFEAVEKKRSVYVRALDFVTAPSFGILLSSIGVFAAFFTGVGTIAAISIVIGWAIAAVFEVAGRVSQIDAISDVKRKRASVDSYVKQSAELERLLNSVNPEILKDEPFLNRLKLGVADVKTRGKYKDNEFKKSKVAVGAFISEFPVIVYTTILNILAFNPIGVGLSVAAIFFGVSGSVVGQVTHKRNINEMENYVGRLGAMHLGITPHMANNTKIIEDMDVIRAHQIEIIKAIKESAGDKKLSVNEIKEMYLIGVEAAGKFAKEVPEKKENPITKLAKVFVKGFDRHYLKNALEATRPDVNKIFNEEMKEVVSEEKREKIVSKIKERVDGKSRLPINAKKAPSKHLDKVSKKSKQGTASPAA